MSYFSEAIPEAVRMLVALEGEVFGAAALSLWVSALAITIASLIGVPAGAALGLARPGRAKRAAIVILNTLMALPTVLIGLVLYGLLSRRGTLGPFGLLHTPWAMVAGQALLVTPIVAALTASAVGGADVRIDKTARSLGAARARRLMTVVSEVRLAVLAAVAAGFGRAIGEVGISMMVGGNIRHYTRNLTTAIALETSRGAFAKGVALGIILLVIALGVNFAVQCLRWERNLDRVV